MLRKSAFTSRARPAATGARRCWSYATPGHTGRLFTVAIIALSFLVLPSSVRAQEAASGSVHLEIRTEHSPMTGRDVGPRAIEWMTPESIEETERLAAAWASGSDAEALRAWRAVVEREVRAQRLRTDEQVKAAASWIAARAMALASLGDGDGPAVATDRREREIRWAVHQEAAAWLRAH